MSRREALIQSVLEEYGALTRQALRRYLPALEPRRYLYDLVADYPRRGGKMMRPSLCIATARAFGARAEEALQAAVSIELFHNALLVHDDVHDESVLRRGSPSLHVLHGVPLALNAGTALALLSLRPLSDYKSGFGFKVPLLLIEELQRMSRESGEGQALELGWRRDNVVDLSDADYFEMVLKKTCWYTTISPMRLGALIGCRDLYPELDTLIRFGFFFGTAFQIRDDVLNLTGDERYGKEIYDDLLEGKRTLMLIHLLTHATAEERERVTAFLASPRADRIGEPVRWVVERMKHYGSIDYAQEVANGLAGAALHEFSLLFDDLPDSRDKRFLAEIVPWVLERTS
ncbi:MAG TPA: polyprenyl synthetase family protein [Thermoanaerobaculia bacterium]|nr:polyprenyl synthetase family protein [Thermoanaerobaculia bacterium]